MKPNRETYPLKVWLAQDCDVLFPRCEHPDTRTNQQFLKAIQGRRFDKWYLKNRRGPNSAGKIICTNNGKVYESMAKASIELGIHSANLSKHLKGHPMYSHVRGLKFKFINKT